MVVDIDISSAVKNLAALRDAFDLPKELIITIARFLPFDDMNSLRQCNRRLSSIIGKSTVFLYKRQPTKQAALAYALASKNVDLWNYAIARKKDGCSKVDYYEVATFFIFRLEKSNIWQEIMQRDIIPHLKNEAKNSRLIACIELCIQSKLAAQNAFDCYLALPHNTEEVAKQKSLLERTSIKLEDLNKGFFVFLNTTFTPWTDDVWACLRNRGILHLWKDHLLDSVAKEHNHTVIMQLINIYAEPVDFTVGIFLQSLVSNECSNDDLSTIWRFVKKGANFINWKLVHQALLDDFGLVILQCFFDADAMPVSAQMEAMLDLCQKFEKQNYTHEKAIVLLVNNLCTKNLISVPEKNQLLHEMARNGIFTALVILLSHGAQVDARNHLQQTPLLVAKKYNQQKIERYLIMKGADQEAIDSFGNSYTTSPQ